MIFTVIFRVDNRIKIICIRFSKDNLTVIKYEDEKVHEVELWRVDAELLPEILILRLLGSSIPFPLVLLIGEVIGMDLRNNMCVCVHGNESVWKVFTIRVSFYKVNVAVSGWYFSTCINKTNTWFQNEHP